MLCGGFVVQRGGVGRERGRGGGRGGTGGGSATGMGWGRRGNNGDRSGWGTHCGVGTDLFSELLKLVSFVGADEGVGAADR